MVAPHSTSLGGVDRARSTATSRIYDTLGLDRLLAALHRFHIGDPPANLPSISDGTSLKAAVLAAGELAEATPMQLVAGYAAIFNGGVYVAPSLTRTNDKAPERVLRRETAETMTTMLERTIASDRGTGKLARIDGLRVAGKTGTADLEGERTYASFVGTVLDRRSPLVILVGLEAPQNDGTGPSAAAPTFAGIARRLFVEK
jgi:cell division protein FtsI (penicillin-binding protein 3)